MAKQLQSVRGMYDILPEDWHKYSHANDTFFELTKRAGYGRIEPPILEQTAVFERGVGQGTDVVSKELYAFADRGGDSLALRPEGTAGIVRAYVEHGMGSWPKPIKLAYGGPMFRYDRPQAGRQRQFFQLGAEVFGEDNPSIDAQVIALAFRFFKALGLEGVTLQINSLGVKADRLKYKKALVEFLTENKPSLAALDQERLISNPMRVLDSKEAKTINVIVNAPQMLHYLSADCRVHFMGVLEYLDALGIEYEMNPLLVRGLDYYNRTVFEFQGSRQGSQASLGGGGRYNGLVGELGGVDIGAVGFALGVERILLELDATNGYPPQNTTPMLYVASLGEPARLAAFTLTEQLQDAGVAAVGSVDKDGIGGQLARASKLGVPYAIIIGQKEVMDGTLILRDMNTGAQETVSLSKAVHDLAKRFLK